MSLQINNGADESIRINPGIIQNYGFQSFGALPPNAGRDTQGGVPDARNIAGYAMGDWVPVPDGTVTSVRQSQFPFALARDFYFTNSAGVRNLIPAGCVNSSAWSIFNSDDRASATIKITSATARWLYAAGLLTADNTTDSLWGFIMGRAPAPAPVPGTQPGNPDDDGGYGSGGQGGATITDAISNGSKALMVIGVVVALIYFVPKDALR